MEISLPQPTPGRQAFRRLLADAVPGYVAYVVLLSSEDVRCFLAKIYEKLSRAEAETALFYVIAVSAALIGPALGILINAVSYFVLEGPAQLLAELGLRHRGALDFAFKGLDKSVAEYLFKKDFIRHDALPRHLILHPKPRKSARRRTSPAGLRQFIRRLTVLLRNLGPQLEGVERATTVMYLAGMCRSLAFLSGVAIIVHSLDPFSRDFIFCFALVSVAVPALVLLLNSLCWRRPKRRLRSGVIVGLLLILIYLILVGLETNWTARPSPLLDYLILIGLAGVLLLNLSGLLLAYHYGTDLEVAFSLFPREEIKERHPKHLINDIRETLLSMRFSGVAGRRLPTAKRTGQIAERRGGGVIVKSPGPIEEVHVIPHGGVDIPAVAVSLVGPKRAAELRKKVDEECDAGTAEIGVRLIDAIRSGRPGCAVATFEISRLVVDANRLPLAEVIPLDLGDVDRQFLRENLLAPWIDAVNELVEGAMVVVHHHSCDPVARREGKYSGPRGLERPWAQLLTRFPAVEGETPGHPVLSEERADRVRRGLESLVREVAGAEIGKSSVALVGRDAPFRLPAMPFDDVRQRDSGVESVVYELRKDLLAIPDAASKVAEQALKWCDEVRAASA